MHISFVNVLTGHTDTFANKFVDGAMFIGELHSHMVNDVLAGDADGDGEHETTSKRDFMNLYDNL